jgi:glutamate dehydrogenase (NAD(P)+)
VFDKLEAALGSAFRAVHDVAEHGDLSLREAAYLIAIDRVAQACRARGWI